jgi:hypothetical protein
MPGRPESVLTLTALCVVAGEEPGPRPEAIDAAWSR